MSKFWLVGQHEWHDSMEVECKGDPRAGASRCYKSQVGVAMQLETRWQGRKPCSTDEKLLCMTDEAWVHGRLQRDFRGAMIVASDVVGDVGLDRTWH